MKRYNFLVLKVLVMSLVFTLMHASSTINLSDSKTELNIKQDNMTMLNGTVNIKELMVDDIYSKDGDFIKISIPGYHSSKKEGLPQLPQMHRLIEIPQNAIPRIEIISEEVEYYTLGDYDIDNSIFPHQPSLLKSQNENDVQFIWDQDYYNINKYNDDDLVRVDIKGMLRSIRIANLVIKPVSYNPVKGTIKVIKNIEFNIYFDEADHNKTARIKEKYYSPYYENIYQTITNYKSPDLRSDLVNYPVTYVIITNPIFENNLSDFINWQIQRGFNVVVGNTADIGSSTSAIKNFIQNLYDNPTDELPAPSFVLFVGDVTQVPTYNGSTGGHVTDLYYCEFTGDFIPEIYHGRFSAENLSQLQSQIDKTLEYEKYEMPDPSYLEEVIMIAGVDAGMAPTYGNGQINYGTDYYFNEDHGVYSHTYLYPESDASSAAAAIIQDFNDGVGFANYTAHCSEAGWADPSFTVSDVPGLYNEHKYAVMIGNCCTSTAFDYGESFGEAVLRAENSGSIGYIGGTNSTYWNEDYWWGVGSGSILTNPTYEQTGPGVYDGMFHEHGEDEGQWFVVTDAINMAGNLAVVEAGGNDSYYWEIYHVMGDPSIIPYIGIPLENNVSHLPILQIGTDSFNVSADPYSHIAISMNGILYGTAFTGLSSNVDMEITPFSLAGTASVVITGQNKQPYMGTVEVGNADGPYVVVDEFYISTSNDDNIIEYSETVTITMDLKNVGSEVTEGVDVNLSIDDDYITIIDAQSSFGDIIPDGIVSSADTFSFNVAHNVPDDYSFTIIATIAGSDQMWQYNLNMKAYAPLLSLEEVIVTDDNNDGQMDPGDTADIGVVIYNAGGALISDLSAIFSISDSYVTLNGSDSFSLSSIPAGATEVVHYSITADEETPIGHIVSFDLAVTGSGNYYTDLTGSISIGLTWEDFESGAFVNLPWNFSGNSDWQVVEDGYEGDYSVRSGSIGGNENSELNISVNVTSSDNISFYYKVSSEGSYDYLRFYIDSSEMEAWSGEVGWNQGSYPVTSGEHTFRWVYEKDGSVDSGSDAAWIDYILFPPIGAPVFPDIQISSDDISVTLDLGVEVDEQFIISNIGEGELQFNIQTILDAPERVAYETLKLDKGGKDPRPGISPSKDSGGPDAFGYTWVDSDQHGVGPGYTWTEIDFCGIPIGASDDSNEGPFELGFPFYFYGNEYNAIRVSTNGFLSFTSTSTAYTNQQIPLTDDPNALLAPFWTDLNPSDGGQMYYYPWGENFIVQWNEVPHYGGGTPETFQVVINADGSILFNYKIVNNGGICTVGIENESGTDGLQVAFNSPFYLHSEMSILFTSNFLQPWLSVLPETGIIPPGGESIIIASFNSSELPEGTYTGNIAIYSNDPDQMMIDLPVSMDVNLGCNNGGDISDDGIINVQDIVLLINCILYDNCMSCSDLNNDGGVDIVDVVLLINIILS